MLIIPMTAEDLQIEKSLSDVSAVAGDLEFPAMLDDNIADFSVMRGMMRFKSIMKPSERIDYVQYRGMMPY